MRYAEKWPQYAKWWDSMTIKPARQREFEGYADKAMAGKDRYLEIQEATAHDGLGADGQGVPWPLIAITHMRESSFNFGTYLGNGQSLARRTTIVPKNRGPFTGSKAFFNGAIDALAQDGLSAVIDWKLEKIIYYCEVFNGGGYSSRGLPSPYVWGGTNIQKPGKYIRDGVFSATAVDTQPGCAPVLMLIMQKAGLTFPRES